MKKAAAYDAARAKYSDALTNLGYQADLQHNVALCYYKNKQYGPALKCIAEIIEKVRRDGGVGGEMYEYICDYEKNEGCAAYTLNCFYPHMVNASVQ